MPCGTRELLVDPQVRVSHLDEVHNWFSNSAEKRSDISAGVTSGLATRRWQWSPMVVSNQIAMAHTTRKHILVHAHTAAGPQGRDQKQIDRAVFQWWNLAGQHARAARLSTSFWLGEQWVRPNADQKRTDVPVHGKGYTARRVSARQIISALVGPCVTFSLYSLLLRVPSRCLHNASLTSSFLLKLSRAT